MIDHLILRGWSVISSKGGSVNNLIYYIEKLISVKTIKMKIIIFLILFSLLSAQITLECHETNPGIIFAIPETIISGLVNYVRKKLP